MRLPFVAFIRVSAVFSTLAHVPTEAQGSALYFQVARGTVACVRRASALGLHCPLPQPRRGPQPHLPEAAHKETAQGPDDLRWPPAAR